MRNRPAHTVVWFVFRTDACGLRKVGKYGFVALQLRIYGVRLSGGHFHICG
jgi:hypothetical protein